MMELIAVNQGTQTLITSKGRETFRLMLQMEKA